MTRLRDLEDRPVPPAPGPDGGVGAFVPCGIGLQGLGPEARHAGSAAGPRTGSGEPSAVLLRAQRLDVGSEGEGLPAERPREHQQLRKRQPFERPGGTGALLFVDLRF